MGWGSAFAGAWETATAVAKAATQQAASTAQTAWDYTKQKAADLYGKASQTASQAVQQGQQAAQSAQNWAGQKIDSAVNAATAAKDWSVEKATAAKDWTVDTVQRTSAAVKQSFDNIDDAFTIQPAGDAAQTCPYAGTGTPSQVVPETQCKPPKDTTPPCCVRSLTVKCGHSDRAFILVPPNTKTNTNNDQIIQVIAEHNEVDKITVDFSAGPCARGNGPNLPCLSFDGFDWPGSAARDLRAPPSPLMPIQSGSLVGTFVPFLEFFRHFVSPAGDADYISYPGSVSCCEGGAGLGFEVQVFPYWAWSGDISAGFEAGEGEDKAKFSVKGELEGSYGTRKVKASTPGFEIELADPSGNSGSSGGVFGGIEAFSRKLLPSLLKFTKGDLVTIEPKLPNVKFGGKMEAHEVEGKYCVDRQGEVHLIFEPLIGVTGTFDALQWLINVACFIYLPYPTSQFASSQIKALRDKAEEGRGGKYGGIRGEVKLDIAATGSIHGELKWEFLPMQNHKAGGKVCADLDISVTGKIEGEIRIWKVSYQAGATIVGESGVGGTIEGCYIGTDPAWDGYLEFKGLKIKAMAYQSLGGSSVGNKKEGAAPIADREEAKGKPGFFAKVASAFTTNYDDARVEDSDNWEMEIIAPAYYGKGTDQSAGGGTGFDGGGASVTLLQDGM